MTVQQAVIEEAQRIFDQETAPFFHSDRSPIKIPFEAWRPDTQEHFIKLAKYSLEHGRVLRV